MSGNSILLLFGPNLDMCGSRDPKMYGTDTLDDHVTIARNAAALHEMTIEPLQSASEAELVAAIHDARSKHNAIVMNPGAFTHYAWSLRDALELFDGPIVEVHLSHPPSREPWRHTSVLAPVVTATIMGCGSYGYELAILAVTQKLKSEK